MPPRPSSSEQRAFVFSNLAMSLDGKIAPASREAFMLGSKRDRAHMDTLRKRADVVIMGAETLRTHRRPCVPRAEKRLPANAIISHRLEGIDPAWPFFTHASLERVLFVAHDTPESRLALFRESCSIVFLEPQREPTATQVIRELLSRHHSRILIEGGGGVMWDFAKLNAIDEYHVTLTPWIIGGRNAPTLVDGEGLDRLHALRLKLKKVKKIVQELYLVYSKAQSK